MKLWLAVMLSVGSCGLVRAGSGPEQLHLPPGRLEPSTGSGTPCLRPQSTRIPVLDNYLFFRGPLLRNAFETYECTFGQNKLNNVFCNHHYHIERVIQVISTAGGLA